MGHVVLAWAAGTESAIPRRLMTIQFTIEFSNAQPLRDVGAADGIRVSGVTTFAWRIDRASSDLED